MKVALCLVVLCLTVSTTNPEDELDIKSSVNVDVDKLDLTEEEKANLMKTAAESEGLEPVGFKTHDDFGKEVPDTVKELNLGGVKDEGKSKPPPGMSSISYKQPELTEEEQKSQYFPKSFLCDACQIVTYELGTDLAKKESKIPKKKKKRTLGEIDLLEVIEEVCDRKKFDTYAVQTMDGQIALKGPAFPQRDDPGMSMGGGLWPVRYSNYCGNIMERVYEDEIYAAYRQGNLFNELCMTGSGSKDCAKILKSVPDAVHFKASLSKDEEICSAGSDSNSGKCTKKPSGKTEL